jgi:mono/diheme cytochrome c family protein
MNAEEKDPNGVGDRSPGSMEANPRMGNGPIPGWLIPVIGFAIFWTGAYLFSYSGGFAADVFDYQPKYGAQAAAAAGPPDPKVLGKKLFSANCVTCHQATGEGQPGQFPPLAGSEFVLGEASNRLIAIVLKGLQGPVQVKGQAVNNAMQAWEGQYTDQQLAAILTYIRSDWGNNAPPVSPEAVKAMRDELKDRKDQWTVAELMKIPPKDVTKQGSTPPQPQQQAGQPQSGSTPPSGAANSPAPGSSPPVK